MAKKSVAQLEAALEAMTARAEAAEQYGATLERRIKHDYIERSEYNRVQAVLRSTQQFCKKYKDRSQQGDDAPSARRAAMQRAKAEAMASGCTVTA